MTGMRERRWDTGAWVVALAVNRAGTHAAAALGDGTVRLLDLGRPDGEPRVVRAHTGACLALVRDVDDRGFLTGGDDGRLVRIDPAADPTADGAPALAEEPGRWIEHVDATPEAGLRAFSAGRVVRLLDGAGRPAGAPLEHPSSVGGLAFAPRGRRLAVAHYGGASLWWTKGDSRPVRLDWKGSHLGVLWHPTGAHLMTTMQEAELHGWRLKDSAHMRMSGYATKVRSMGWTAKGRWLATGGADVVVCWPFFGGGPWDRAPMELRGGWGALVTTVAPHPSEPVVAAGCETGQVFAAALEGGDPVDLIRPEGDAITALSWSRDGRNLLIGTEGGRLSWLPLGPA
jgi:WD40 repeat protein